jgi:hypothetical protein
VGEATSIEWQLAAAANSDFYDFRQFQAYAEGGGAILRELRRI